MIQVTTTKISGGWTLGYSEIGQTTIRKEDGTLVFSETGATPITVMEAERWRAAYLKGESDGSREALIKVRQALGM